MNLSYTWQSIKTKSYWEYALWTYDSLKMFLAVLGAFWTIFEMISFFKLLDQNKLPSFTFLVLLVVSLIIVIITRRPITNITYKVAGRDQVIVVKIGDIFNEKGQKVISTNTTFDTDIQTGIIAQGSLQGQFTKKYFPQNIQALDSLIDNELVGLSSVVYQKRSGKDKKYPLGTTVRMDIMGETFYWLAMSNLNYDNTAGSTLQEVLTSLDGLWDYIIAKGENDPIVLPLVGTGRGRLKTHRKRVIARLAQSFTQSSEHNVFSKKLIIVVHPSDAEEFAVNLFEVRDLLKNYLP
ncbi:macro domain-containing protein [Chryseobacterium sp. KCF3-3]|uniref:macro domain-containing protein n=1 Tax=Chryseobacterium sp. KCF3-3 TaxID=3231511 RepID=UPI0038B361E2